MRGSILDFPAVNEMSAVEDGEQAPAEVHAIGISFGNSNSSIAYTSGVRITR